ncbi:9764_t:CDS:2, partial [Gigaspora rosea]
GCGVPLAWLLTESSDSEYLWHVKRAWLRWITKKIDKDKHESSYHNLEQLLHTKHIDSINSALVQFEQRWQDTPILLQSANSVGDYTIQKTMDNEPTLVCNCKAYLRNPVL